AEIFRRATAHVQLQESRCRQQERHRILANQRPDGFCIERVRMINRADSNDCRHAERARESKRMEKWQHTKHAILFSQAKNLFELLDVRTNIIMAEHHALRLASTAAGKDHRSEVIQLHFLLTTERALQQSSREKDGHEQCHEFFTEAR